ncbi:PhzF family phenazine biosynthesis protein [Achromobacter arsenitoxydans]|uniref:Phenazine biosynthesis PhzC/PhzF-like protein n=1 Tax=Achromobacter arsenitoxydans SY8 TaxID=477184 RepID=H0F4S4_9BURK|nr:PhzF family phenazine biosynthesis protein [Achromobacter arsenitoxydans]EHK66725.1 Phenazine biosynthesis PhzC/PhzF-like protein [Achromobacter arsenitoxydans SY8]
MTVAFKQVDVFTREPYRGNPVAVVLDAQGLSDEQMRRIANWTNLSETTFVLPATQPGADYRVRIFTPQAELPFAGHPTLGTAHALLEAGIVAARGGRLVQECAAGLIELTVAASDGNSPLIAFTLPDPALTPLDAEQVKELEAILGAAVLHDPVPKRVNVGPVWTIAQMASAQAVLTVKPDFARMADFDRANKAAGIVVYGANGEGAESAIEVRAFAPSLGANEDPVCGSGNGSVAAFIRDAGQVAQFGIEYLSTQGAAVGRAGRIHIEFDGAATIRVGGQCVTCIDGRIAV